MEQPTAIRYTIQPHRPDAHLFRVELEVDQPAAEGQSFTMPAWIPGSYMIRDFARNVISLAAECAGQAVAVRKIDKQTWRCAPCEGRLTLRYEVYCWDLSVRGAHLDATHGYFNGTGVFLAVEGREGEPCTVAIQPPPGEGFDRWRVATTLPSAGAAPYGFGAYRAGDYDELIDHPVEMGEFDLVEFEVAGKPHAMAITGRQDADNGRLAADLKRICENHTGLFGEFPDERYLFLTLAVGEGYGGLEHRASSSLMARRDDLPRPGLTEPDEGYRNFLGLCSHEYFHTWNIKRIKPTAFTPYDLSREVHTSLLWLFEGVTSYYDELALVRAGLLSPESYLELLGQLITRVLRTPGRYRQTISESSFDAWTKLYKQDENGPNAIISYYAKGALIALTLDLTIRQASDGRRSLDDVMRGLWNDFGKKGIGVAEADVEQYIESVAEVPLNGFFELALRSTDDLPLAETLAWPGVGLHLRPAESDSDKGGKPGQKQAATRPHLGLRLATDASEARIQNVFEGSPAMAAGLSAGDTLVAIDGIRVDRANMEARLNRYRPGQHLAVHAFRRDELMRFDVSLGSPPEDTCYLTLDEVDPEVLRRRQAWLGG